MSLRIVRRYTLKTSADDTYKAARRSRRFEMTDAFRPSSSRRRFIQAGLGAAGGIALPAGLMSEAFAADQPPIGTWPAGTQGDSVFIGITVPRTGTYAVQGEDELKGYQLAI